MADEKLLRAFVAAAKRQGLTPRLVLLKEKRAVQKGWPKRNPSVDAAVAHVRRNPSKNAVGVQPSSLDCVVLDCDEGDGPRIAAEIVRNSAGDVIACVTPSTSGRQDRGHVWIRCANAEDVGNWKFDLEKGIDEVCGDMRASSGQVRLTDAALAILAETLLDGLMDVDSGLEDVAPISFFQGIRSSTTAELDPDFDRTKGNAEVSKETISTLGHRLDGRDGTPRHEHLFALVADIKLSGASFDATLDLLSEHVPLWLDENGADDGKYAGTELERHLAMSWSKLPAYVSPEDDFEDDPEDDLEDDATAVRRDPAKIRPVARRGLQLNGHKRAMDTYTNARVGILGQGLRPAYNELKQTVTFLGHINWPESYGRELSDHTARMVRDLLIEAYQGVDFQPTKDNVYEAIMSVCYANKFHPVLDYLDGLIWDGVPRCDALFTEGFPCVDDARYLAECSLRFMISAVARARRPGCKVDTMPVVCSPQGALKSTGVRVLFGDDWASDAAMPDLKSKDAAIVLRGTWCHEYAELAGMGNQDIATLKAFLSRATDTYRAPYGRTAEDHPRRCVFFGTVNETGYLRDPTGGRRFWPMQMAEGKNVDVEWIAQNRDQLWAEADARLAAGERWWLEAEEWDLALERASEETVEDPWTGPLMERLDYQPDPEEEDDYPLLAVGNRVSTMDLLEVLGISSGRARTAESKRLRTVMEKEIGGWKYRRKLRIGTRVLAGYYRIDAEENAAFHGR